MEPSLYAFIPIGLVGSSLDIDMTTLAAGSSLVQKNSGSFPFSWVNIISGGDNTESLQCTGVVSTIFKSNTATGVDAHGTTPTTATFGTPFPGGVRIVLISISATSSTAHTLWYEVSAKSSTGFTVSVFGGTPGSTVSLDWAAVGF